jgi:multidrug efflux pump subunit AcrB
MIRFFASHPTAANILMVVLIALGVLSLPQQRRATFPDFAPREVQISVPYPGATAGEVEEAICQRVEDAVDGLNYVGETRSEAREGVGMVVVEMAEGGDFGAFLDDVRSAVEAIGDFPEEAEDPVIEELGQTDLVVSVAVTAPMEPAALKAYCEELKRRLTREFGVSSVEVLGFSDQQIRIEVSALTLMQYGISVADLAATISRQAVDLPAGTIEGSVQDVLVRLTDERRTARELAELVVVSGTSGAEIRLGEIATITDVFENEEEKVLFGGKRSGMLRVTKSKEEDTLRVFDRVEAFVEEVRQEAPPGVELALTQDVSSIVRDRLWMLIDNGWQGLVLVFLTLWLFFGMRYAFWVAMGLPVSFLGALYLLPQIGLTVDMISMVGMLLAIGLLMDDAIVLAESVATHLEKGKGPLDAVVDGVAEVRVGVMASFVTTLVVFGPLCFLSGSIGRTMRVMPLVLLLVLSVSLIEAFLILPNHLGHALRHQDRDRESRFRRRFEERFAGFRERVGRFVDLAVSWRYLTIGLTVLAFLLSMSMLGGGVLKFQSFPSIDGDVVQARLLLPQGTPLARTEKVTESIVAAAQRVNQELSPRQPQEQNLVRSFSVQYNTNVDAFETGPHVATVTVDLLNAETRRTSLDDFVASWREQIGDLTDVLSLTISEPTMGPAGRPLEIRLQGRDLDQLKAAAIDLTGWLGSFTGVLDLNDDLRPGKPELQIELREGAASVGLDAQTIGQQLRSAFYGTTASEIQVGSEAYEIDVQLAAVDQDSIADLEYFHIALPDGRQIPLGTVATVRADRSWGRIARIDGLRTVTVRGDVETEKANTAEIAAMLEKEYLPEFTERHSGVSVQLAGEVEESATTLGSIAQSLTLGMLGIFLLLAFQFRNYVEPLVVMAAIPLTLIGVVWGHLALGLVLTVPSLVGFVSLAGIVVNDSILMVEFIKLRRRDGLAVVEAAQKAPRDRLRAVLLTSATTIAGLLPLLTERSLQAQFLIPLAASIVFGLAATTILVLVVVPCLYTIVDDLGWGRSTAPAS